MKYSIVVPVAPDRNAPVIESINCLDYPRDMYEIIVEKGDNASQNRNRGIEEANGYILAFVDDDAYVKSDWLRQADRFLQCHSEIDIVGGPQLTALDDGLFARQSGYVFSSNFGAGKMSTRYRSGKENLNADELNITSCNMFVRESVFSVIGNFHSHLFPNEETELIQRALACGFRVGFSPDIVVYHKRRKNYKSYINQCFKVGRGRARQDALTGSRASKWVAVPMLFAIYILTIPLLYWSMDYGLVPLLIYFLLCIVSASAISIRESDGLALVFYPILCLSLHLVYPLGYMYEWIDKHWFKGFSWSQFR